MTSTQPQTKRSPREKAEYEDDINTLRVELGLLRARAVRLGLVTTSARIHDTLRTLVGEKGSR